MDNSLLYKLPPELRNTIYDLVLLHPVQILVSLDLKEHRRWQAPALLQVSENIRQEASSIYYSANTFAVRSSWNGSDYDCRRAHDQILGKWLGSLAGDDRDMIRYLRVDDVLYNEEEVKDRAEGCRVILKDLGLNTDRVRVFLELEDEEGSRMDPEWWVEA